MANDGLQRFIRTALGAGSGILKAKRQADSDIATQKRQRSIDELNRMLGYSRIDEAEAATELSQARTETLLNPKPKTPTGFELSADQDRYEWDTGAGAYKVVASRKGKPEKSSRKVKLEIAPGFTAEGESVDDVAATLDIPKEDLLKMLGATGGAGKNNLSLKDVLGAQGDALKLTNDPASSLYGASTDSLALANLRGARSIADSLGIGKQPMLFGQGKETQALSDEEKQIIDYAKKTGKSPDWETLESDGFDVEKLKAAMGL